MTSRELALDAAREASARSCPLADSLARLSEHAGLDTRDRALAEEIALGALRRRLQLDLVISRASSRPLKRVQQPLLGAIRQAAYQIMFLDRVPAHAAVNEAVELVKSRLGDKPAAFANAVLRAVTKAVVEKNAPRPEGRALQSALASRDGRFVILADPLLRDPGEDPVGWLTGAYGYPRWMVERWAERHGPEMTERILEWGNATPPLTVRLDPRKVRGWPLSEDEAARVLAGCASFEPGRAENTYRIVPEAAPPALPGLAGGLYSFQDEAQVRPARVLAPPEGATVLDLCSGLGTKSVQLAEIVGPRGRVVAVEIDPQKTARAQEAALRMGHRNIAFVQADATSLAGPAAREYPYVLLDAPCSNMGALDRRPEVRFRTNEGVIRDLVEDESELLAAAAERVTPGGALVYSVCTFEPEETEAVLRRFLDSRSEFALEAEHLLLPEAGVCGGGYSARLARSGG